MCGVIRIILSVNGFNRGQHVTILVFILKTPILALNRDMGWSSRKLLRHIKMTKYWNRLINMNEDRLTKKVFLYDKSQCKFFYGHLTLKAYLILLE